LKGKAMTDEKRDQPDQAAFEIQGPDDQGLVWICSSEGRDVWCHNLGPVDQAAEVMAQWLGSIDHQERF
jgi:hypothetical protein